jgi:hypothetical protein
MSVLSGVTIRLGNNIRLRGYNQTEDGENNGYPLVFINGDAEISGNVNQQSGKDGYGSGVYLKSGDFTMKGGVVKENAIDVDGGKTSYGAGVFAEGGVRVDSGNEVCLWESAIITLTGNLSETPTAVIRPGLYTIKKKGNTGKNEDH